MKNIHQIDFPTFSDFMSQKSKIVKQRSTLFDSLVERSIEAFYNSIVIYNNPLIEYRIESFCILLINAWELLLKARIIELYDESKIYREKNKTISFFQCLEIIFPDKNDNIRKNLEILDAIRDQAVHLLIPDIQSTLSRLFQASIFNYIKLVKTFKYPNPYMKETPGLMTFITSIEDIEDRTIASKYGEITSAEIKEFKERIYKEEEERKSEKFIIPIGYKIVLTKNEAEGDLKISTSPDGESAMIIKVPKDNNKTHPFRSTDIILSVNSYFGKQVLNTYSVQAIIEKEKIRKEKQNKYYFFIENPETHKYSQEFIDMIIHKIESHDDYIDNARKLLKKIRRQKSETT